MTSLSHYDIILTLLKLIVLLPILARTLLWSPFWLNKNRSVLSSGVTLHRFRQAGVLSEGNAAEVSVSQIPLLISAAAE